jgi:polar amino acid transport system substrate-binding protein
MVALMEHTFQPIGIQVKGRQKPFMRAVDDLNKGRVDAHVGTFATNWDGYLFPRWHFFTSHIAVIFKRKPSFIWSGYDSLKGKRIGWIRGYFFNLFFDEKIPIKVLEVSSLQQCVNLLNAGRLDFCMDGLKSGILPIMQEMGLDKETYQIETSFLEPSFLRFLDTSRSREIITAYDKRMDELYHSGELTILFKKWGWNPISPDETELAKRPKIVLEELLNGTGEWAKFVEYLNP